MGLEPSEPQGKLKLELQKANPAKEKAVEGSAFLARIIHGSRSETQRKPAVARQAQF